MTHVDEKTRKGFKERAKNLATQYPEMSKMYQKSKKGTDIPLK